MKKRVRPIEELEEKRVIGNKPSAKAAGKVHAKGGHLSPLTVGSSGDKQQQPPAIDNAAMCIRDEPPDVTKVRRAHPVAKGSQPLLTKAMYLLQEDEDSQNNCRAMCPEASVDHPPSAQVMEASILPVAPSSPHNSDHPAELTEDNGQSVILPPLPSKSTRDSHALHDDRRHLSDEPRSAYMYHEDLERQAYTRRPQPGGDYPYRREYSYYGDHGETYPPGYAYAPHHESTGYRDATGYRRPYYRDTRYPDRELLDDHLHGPPLPDTRGEYMHPTSREGHAGYERAYQRQPPRADGHHESWSPIANVPPTLPGQETEQEQREGAAIPRQMRGAHCLASTNFFEISVKYKQCSDGYINGHVTQLSGASCRGAEEGGRGYAEVMQEPLLGAMSRSYAKSIVEGQEEHQGQQQSSQEGRGTTILREVSCEHETDNRAHRRGEVPLSSERSHAHTRG
ncbi:hypothetical protein DFH29DRAFT_878752 [Suillus ampliporus]|nr:hypothetical protein DFH29DRAFT_878752 [Suillus ampliporus]